MPSEKAWWDVHAKLGVFVNLPFFFSLQGGSLLVLRLGHEDSRISTVRAQFKSPVQVSHLQNPGNESVQLVAKCYERRSLVKLLNSIVEITVWPTAFGIPAYMYRTNIQHVLSYQF